MQKSIQFSKWNSSKLFTKYLKIKFCIALCMSILYGPWEVQYLMLEQGLPDSALGACFVWEHIVYTVLGMLQKPSLKSPEIGKGRQEHQLRQGAGTWPLMLWAQEQSRGSQEEACVSVWASEASIRGHISNTVYQLPRASQQLSSSLCWWFYL